MKLIDHTSVVNKMKPRLYKNVLFKLIFLAATMFGLLILGILLYRILTQGAGYLDMQFLQSLPSRKPELAGVKTALIGTIWLMGVVAPVSLLLGVGTAIYLEEYAKKNKFTDFIQVNISNLAGVPSIVFGLLGLTVFVRAAGFGTSVIAAGLTMSLLVLPIIIVASQEAIRSVPKELREASYGMGATKWQTIVRVVMPAAVPGILTGGILALSRAIGETAPLVVLGLPLFLAFLPRSVFDMFTVLPMQIYNWTGRPQEEFQALAAAGIIVLLVLLIGMNSVAVLIRNKFQKRY
ncbi:phosphate ABC transporter permease PstA [Bacillus infantis]|jgi:phosphate transport system permease protein|uniref:Phosphate transport system permease protein PstA n=2 Tax=Bacillus infantis TaxID=324767 RepID=U5LFZ0_9BACI|nr:MULTISPECIES: phosphate ABC transporter permease PstA [Bacillus]OXT19109.1 phosphate ABC transporter, permease protein PstA [Bacillus sp. OG2]AGX05522.1 phosphate ABC transporter permease [Bacillus infantis NRRL B-14911]EAR65144.1 phosphate ABC transporter, permease protein, putative [Bacillus sp. NRRL B-14911]MCA1036233.1 phosphate ABC transporter permease PstA [Bacillus infantis]MCA1039116.1 phosphate ABC transporter permease PstA [Bacillus infantis]